MIGKRLSQTISLGVFFGFLIGLQQSSSVIISSLHDLDRFPYLSLVAISFVIILAIFLLTAVLFLATLILSLITRARKIDDESWLAILVGLTAFAWGYTFLFFRFGAILGKSFLIPLVLLLATAVAGGVFGFMFYAAMRVASAYKKLKKVIGLSSFWVPRLALAFFSAIFLFLLFNAFGRLTSGPVGFALSSEKKEAQAAANVVLITIDALRADVLTGELMPQISAFSQEGLVFTRAYAPSPWTAPTFASLFSGQDPGAIGSSVNNFSMYEATRHHRLQSQLYTLTEKLEDTGFLTQAIITNKNVAVRRGYNQGFAGFINFEDIMPYHWHFHAKNMVVMGVALKIPVLGGKVPEIYDLLVGKSATDFFRTRAATVTESAKYWLSKKRQEPFFLWAHYIDPHSPYNPVEQFSPQLDLTSEQEQQLREAALSLEDVRWRKEAKEAFKQLYDGETGYVDSEVGKLLDFLREEGFLDSTIVIITSDHGEEFFEHGNIGHGKSLFEELVKVPLVVRFEGDGETGVGVLSKPVSLTDFGSTLLALLGLEEGSSRSWFSAEYSPILFAEANVSGPELKAAIFGRWKLVWNTFEDSFTLYDLIVDPNETTDVSRRNPLIVNRLAAFLKDRAEQNRAVYEQSQEEGFAPPVDFGEVVGY